MNVSILLRHSAKWVSEVAYEGYRSDGIVVGENISFVNMNQAIASELNIDQKRKRIVIRYVVQDNSSPITIRNDMGVKLYIEIKKNEPSFGTYPLCIDMLDLKVGEIEEFDCVAGSIVCAEETQHDDDVVGAIEFGTENCCYEHGLDVSTIFGTYMSYDIKEKQVYKDKATLIAVMGKYKVAKGYNFRVKRSYRKSYVLKCFSEDCAWRMKASCTKNTEMFKIRYFNDVHTCPMRERILNKVEATLSFVSCVTVPKMINHKRSHTPNDIVDDVKAAFGVDITYQKAWRAKERALEILRGKPADGYKCMPRYIHMLNIVYPNSYIKMHKSVENEFKYLFIALRPLMRGYQFCRPVVVVDGAHLSGAYKGTFVTASTLDGAGCILPLAYGVVDTENDASWTWFFQQFKNAFGERENMCVVSDRNESILKSVSIVFPNVPHYVCIWHVWKNVCTNFRKSRETLSDMYYSMAKCYRIEEFDKIMSKIENVDHRVKDYLQNVGYEKWARVHATVNRGRMMTSNIAECINGCLVNARQLPIIDFLEEARILFGSWNCKNREKASYNKDTLGRKFEDILVENTINCSRMKVIPSSEYIFSVYDSGRRYVVFLERKKCSCGRFQFDEIPCSHAVAVLKKRNVVNMHPYCSDYYKPEALANTYEVPMVPMPDKGDWTAPKEVEGEIVLPPKYKRMPGRPKKGRKKNAGEKKSTSTNRCGRCGHEGHNRRTCNFFPVEK